MRRHLGIDAFEDIAHRGLAAVMQRAVPLGLTLSLNHLIQDLLDVTRIEAGQLAIEPGREPPVRIIAEALEAQKAPTAAAAVELMVDLPPELPDVMADRDRLIRVFENLIGNAIKFASEGGRIIVGAETRGDEVLFWVADDGPGIPADAVTHLFDRFWQIEHADRRGAGLGLTIVKAIVERHGGTMAVDSRPGHTTFTILLPD